MRAEIISVGTELLLGQIANTDARDVSIALASLGINVYHHTVVGDNPTRLSEVVKTARTRSELIVTTGGLGPTFDDLTKQTLAECFGKKLVLHEEELSKIRAFFEKIGREMTENNIAQAYLPEGCDVLCNDWGTAPGCAFCVDGVTVIMLPGPPRECIPMIEKRMVPYLEKLTKRVIFSNEINIFGMGESSVEAKIKPLADTTSNPTIAPYAKDSEVMLRVSAAAETRAAAQAMNAPIIKKLRELLGDVIYDIDSPSIASTAVTLLKSAGKTLSVAESCTGGLLSEMITSVSGASAVYMGGICAYSPRIKRELLGVSDKALEAPGAVSEQVARELARGAAEALSTDMAIGITGFAGPDGGTEENPRGTVYVCLYDGEYLTRRISNPRGREVVRIFAAKTALSMIIDKLRKM